MALSRTSVALALIALLAGCGYDPSPSATRSAPAAARTNLEAVQQQPLTVKGTGFRPHERVALSAKGLQSSSAKATADASGEFETAFHGLKACDSVTVAAVGSKGSGAEFNFSQIACTGT